MFGFGSDSNYSHEIQRHHLFSWWAEGNALGL
jgi:hypothetical protein